jgi:hypothetical protein
MAKSTACLEVCFGFIPGYFWSVPQSLERDREAGRQRNVKEIGILSPDLPSRLNHSMRIS